MLEYTNISQLVSSRNVITGTVGKTEITVTLSNGPTISGPLNTTINTWNPVKGKGAWTQNYYIGINMSPKSNRRHRVRDTEVQKLGEQ